MGIKYLDEFQSSLAIDAIANVLVYFDQFKIFTTPSEKQFVSHFNFEDVERVYDASIVDEQNDILFNISFRFNSAYMNARIYAYAHMRIDENNKLVRGTLFVTMKPKIFFMTTLPSIEQTDSIYNFLKEDGLDLCFDDTTIPKSARISRRNYTLQINTP